MIGDDGTISFALGTFSIAGSAGFAGLVIAERVIAVRALNSLAAQLGGEIIGADTVFGILGDWTRNLPLLKRAARIYAAAASDSPLKRRSVLMSALHVHAPVEQPRQILMARANYRTHVIELMLAHGKGEGSTIDERRASVARMMDRIANEGEPFAFVKLPSALAGPYDTISIPGSTEKLDWEMELAVVIGRAARHVSRGEAMNYIAGYCNANDMSARDLLFRDDLGPGHDWTSCKCAPGFMPMGPYLVPAHLVSDPHDLKISLKLNGKTMQDARTNDMIHGIPRLIEYLSSRIQLWPGDIISTGSPDGNGMQLGVFVRPGDVIEGCVDGLGTLRNSFVAEGAA